MSLVKHNSAPAYFPKGFSSILDNFFDDNYVKSANEIAFRPTVDISESDKDYRLELTIPGVEKENITIDLKDNFLIISGERKKVEKESTKKYLKEETVYGSFKRSFQLPENVDAETITAELNQGVLSIVIPKDEKKVLTKTISIK